MIENIVNTSWAKRIGTLLAVVVALCAFGSAAAHADTSEASSPYATNLQNGGFEVPALTKASTGWTNVLDTTSGISWRTTATDSKIEYAWIPDNANNPHMGTNNPYIREGSQFAELNANQRSSLYQYISTDSRKKYEWSLSHRGRSGVDTMALVIGPKQPYDPKKTSSSSQDQLMQIVDWLKNQSDVVIGDISQPGCSEKYTLFTSQFNESGGFVTGDPFSWTKDATHAECWSVWIISSGNGSWVDYGFVDPDAAYDFSYLVPDGSDVSLFGFVSYQPAPKPNGTIDYTYGNLLDNVAFNEYYHVRCATTISGDGEVRMPSSSETKEDFAAGQDSFAWISSGSDFTVTAKPNSGRNFLGAIVNGAFVSVDLWSYNEADGSYSYEVANVQGHYEIRLVFSAEKVLYDVNGGDPYHYDDGEGHNYEVPLPQPDVADPAERNRYTSHEATSSIDGWRFSGWQYTDIAHGSTVFDAIHTISYVPGVGQDTLSIAGKLFGASPDAEDVVLDGISALDGVTMVAQWTYRQRFATQVWDPDACEGAGGYVFDSECGSIVGPSFAEGVAEEPYYETVDGVDKEVGKEYYVSDSGTAVNILAAPNDGFRFVGWYDAEGNLLSESRAYAYQVDARQVTTLFARFMPSGSNLQVTKSVSGPVANLSAYFTITVSLENASPHAAYKVTVPTTTQVRPLEGGALCMSATSLVTDDAGKGSAVVYLKHNQTATIFNVPDQATFSVAETAYESYGYRTAYDFGPSIDQASASGIAVSEADSVLIKNISFAFNLQVAKNGLVSNDVNDTRPLAGAGFTLYSDAACTTEAYPQQTTEGEQGVTTFANLAVGKTFFIKETYVPSGFQASEAVYELRVKPDGVYCLMQGEGGALATEVKLDAVEGDPSTFRIAFTNAVMLEMPTTGSAYTPRAMQVFGMLAMGIAVVLALRRARCKRGAGA